MGTYLLPIKDAFLSFPFMAMLLTIPFLIFNYRKYGYINKFRVFVTFSFLLYCIAALYLVILPFPTTRDTCSLQPPDTVYHNFIPFTFIHDFLKETGVSLATPSTYLHFLTERSFLQIVFNFILLLPLGVYVRYFLNGKKVWISAVIGFFVSLFFETTQGTGLYGYYNCPYRLFDVDDLMLNTAGAIVGFFIAPIFLFLFPSKEDLDVGVEVNERPVSLVHRFIAFFLDLFILNAIISWIDGVGHHITRFIYPTVTFFCIYFFYFILFVYLTNGRTLGMFIVRLKIYGRFSRLRLKEVMIRNGALYFGYGLLTFLSVYTVTRQGLDHNIKIFGVLFVTIIQILFYSHFIWRIIHRKRTFYYELLSKTRVKRNN